MFLPVQHTVVSQSGPGPKETLQLETGYRSLLQTESASILLAAGLPVLIALLPLAFAGGRHARRVEISTAVLLTVFVVIAGFSIGFFYVPAALAAILVAPVASGTARRVVRASASQSGSSGMTAVTTSSTRASGS